MTSSNGTAPEVDADDGIPIVEMPPARERHYSASGERLFSQDEVNRFTSRSAARLRRQFDRRLAELEAKHKADLQTRVTDAVDYAVEGLTVEIENLKRQLADRK